MSDASTGQLTAGEKIIQGLTEFRDALASGEDLNERFIVRSTAIPSSIVQPCDLESVSFNPMPLPTAALRKLVSLDPADALSRFALGKRLFETAEDPAQYAEAVEHLSFANAADPSHLATYHLLGQALLKTGDVARAKAVLTAGIERVAGVGHGMGRDLGPAMAALLASVE